MKKKDNELNLYLIWGVLSAISATVHKIVHKNTSRNKIISYRGIDFQKSNKKSDYYSLVNILLSMTDWDEVEKKDFYYQKITNESNILAKIKIYSYKNYLKCILSHRFISIIYSFKYKKIKLIASCNIAFVSHFFGRAYSKYSLIEHGSPIYRSIFSEIKKDSYNRYFIFLKRLKYFINLARVTEFNELFTIYSKQRSEENQIYINKIYLEIIDKFFENYKIIYPEAYKELVEIKSNKEIRKIAILGPTLVDGIAKVDEYYLSIKNIMIDRDVSKGIIKPHPDDHFDYQKHFSQNSSIISFKNRINNALPVEFLVYFLNCYGYIGAPTISSIYLCCILMKDVIIIRSNINDKENEFEFGLVHKFLMNNFRNFKIIKQ